MLACNNLLAFGKNEIYLTVCRSEIRQNIVGCSHMESDVYLCSLGVINVVTNYKRVLFNQDTKSSVLRGKIVIVRGIGSEKPLGGIRLFGASALLLGEFPPADILIRLALVEG